MEINERLTALREDRDITQNEIARVLGCQQSAVSKYEKGRAKYSVDDLKKLCLFYNVSADYILNLPDDLPHPKR